MTEAMARLGQLMMDDLASNAYEIHYSISFMDGSIPSMVEIE